MGPSPSSTRQPPRCRWIYNKGSGNKSTVTLGILHHRLRPKRTVEMWKPPTFVANSKCITRLNKKGVSRYQMLVSSFCKGISSEIMNGMSDMQKYDCLLWSRIAVHYLRGQYCDDRELLGVRAH